MSSVDSIVDIQNVISDVAPTRPSFGIPLFIGYHTHWVDRVSKLYESTDEMVTDGFALTDALYLAVQSAKSQNPSPAQVMVGRRVVALTQIIWFTPADLTIGHVYSGTIDGVAFTYPVVTGTVAAICAGIVALLPTLPNGAIANSTTRMTLTATPGKTIAFSVSSNLTQLDSTADTTTDDTIVAIDTELDGQDTTYYGVTVVDSQSKATGLLAAATLEAKTALGVLQSADDACLDSVSTTDIMAALQAASYTRTGVFYHRMVGGTEWLAAGVLGGRLPVDPGQETWAFKTVAGVTVDTLNGAAKASVDSKNGNIYVKSHGTPITWEGKAASGRYFDSTRFIDWETSTIDFDLFEFFKNNPKVGFTNLGLSRTGLVLEGSLQKGVAADGIDGVDTPPTVTVPTLASTSTSDRAHRIAKGFKYGYRLTGALHSVQVRGAITV